MDARLARAEPELPPAPHAAPLLGGKETSPELATLAGRYMAFDAQDVFKLSFQQIAALSQDVRRLAASVLTQFEGGKP